jgi:transposase
VSELTALSNRIQKRPSGTSSWDRWRHERWNVKGDADAARRVTDVEVMDLAGGAAIGPCGRHLEGQLTEAAVASGQAAALRRAEAALEQVEERIDQEIQRAKATVREAIVLLDGIPGIGETTAEAIISEIGVDMTRFPTAGHLASWAGMCPGNDESAGKRRNTRTNPANRYLKGTMVEAAWAASHTKDTFLSALDRRLVRRMGKK